MAPGKLTTIVAIDICGYSARAQADEAGAIASVARLNERCAEAAQEHGGRIFSRAGDAVMLEFTSVSGGLTAAQQLAADPDPPIRVGVHLGEVSEMPDGDLLGHGVNVAARLQSQAPVGGVLVSEDARRAMRGPLADRLVARGVIKLDKIDESIGVYELSAGANQPPRVGAFQFDLRSLRPLAIGAIALTAAVALGALIWPLLATPPAARVAVFSPVAPVDSGLETLTTGVADDIALALGAIGIETVARAETAIIEREARLDRARALNAQFAVDGAAEADGDVVRLTINIVRTSDRTMLFSEAFEAPSDGVSGLRSSTAERSADVLACAARIMPERRGLDNETLALFLRGCGARRSDPMGVRDAMAEVVEREPRIVFARALLALSSVVASDGAPETMRAALLQDARTHAERAIRDDPNIAESYIALSLLEHPADLQARERWLLRAIERDVRSGTAHNFYSNLLQEVGRLSEALAFAQRAVALDPLSHPKRRNLAYLLALTGRQEEARELAESMLTSARQDALWRLRMRLAIWSGRWDEASSLLAGDNTALRSNAERTCWRIAVQTARGAARTAEGLLTCVGANNLPVDVAGRAFVAARDLEGAFTLLARTHSRASEILFAQETAALRRDHRFMPMMRDIGLLQYWRDSGHWPDFCNEPGLPYRCEAEAARLI